MKTGYVVHHKTAGLLLDCNPSSGEQVWSMADDFSDQYMGCCVFGSREMAEFITVNCLVPEPQQKHLTYHKVTPVNGQVVFPRALHHAVPRIPVESIEPILRRMECHATMQ